MDEAEKVLTSRGDLNEFGRLLDYTWRLKRGISGGISTDSIDGLYAKGMKAGALGGKLLGAGGGGFLLFYVEEDKQGAVHKAMEELLYVPFKFENSGTRVIHYTPEIEKRPGPKGVKSWKSRPFLSHNVYLCLMSNSYGGVRNREGILRGLVSVDAF